MGVKGMELRKGKKYDSKLRETRKCEKREIIEGKK